MLGWLLLFLLPAGTATVSGQTQPEFRWSYPLPHGNNIADLVYRAGVYHHVTDYGGIYASSNRLVWERRTSGTRRDLRAAVWMGSRLLVTGEEGTALWSDDGVAFQPAAVSPATTDWFEGVAANGAVAVAVGDNGAIYRSTNGLAWDRVGAGFTSWLSGVGYGAGAFVAVGETGFIASSPDGATWSRRTSGTTLDLQRVTYGDGRFIVVAQKGVVLTSTNGVAWTPDTTVGVTNTLLAAAAPFGERLVVGESALLLRRTTGGWENQLSSAVSPSPAPPWTYAAAVWDGQRYVVGGRTGVLLESYRTNGIPWIGLTFWFRGDDSLRNWLWEVTRVGGVYLAVGDQATILSSANGVDWQPETPPAAAATTLYGVGGSTDIALAVGEGGVLLRSGISYTNVPATNLVVAAGRTNQFVGTNRVSLTGVVWETTAAGLTTNTLQGVGWNGSQWVVVGAAGTVLSSGDGTNWTRRAVAGAGFLSGVTAFAGQWIACGTGGAIYTSPDSTNWTLRTSGTTNWIYRVRSLETGTGPVAVATGQNGTLLTSTNGVDWVPRVSGSAAFLTDARAAGGAIYVCGTAGTLLRSVDLAAWSVVDLPTGKTLNGLAGSGSQLITAGAEGVVLRANLGGAEGPVNFHRFGIFAEAPPPVAGFVFSGTPESRFQLEEAEDLGAWGAAAELELDANGSATHGRVASEVRRFYRTRLLP